MSETTKYSAERRYLLSWDYNAARILDELEKIVLDQGGALVSTWQKGDRKQFAIINRSLTAAIREHQERIERLEKFERVEAAAMNRKELERLEAIENEPHITPYGDYRYISFALNGMYFYYELDRNPFFPFHYRKSPIVNGEIDYNHWSYEDKKDWLYDCFFGFRCSQADRVEAANMIFNMLMNSAVSGNIRPKRPAKLTVLLGSEEALK